jgi:branched-chain amino acid transport system substrate-binding protein
VTVADPRGGLIAAAVIVAAALLLAVPARAQTVKIGLILTYSGADAEPSEEIDKGLSLYLAEHERDLPPGVRIELVRRDDTGPRPETAKRLAQELVTRERVQFLAGVFWTPNAFAIAPVASEAKVPLVIMNASGSAITRASPYIVRTSWTVWQNAYPLGEWAAAQGWRTGYTLVSDYAPGHDGEAAFIKGFTEKGGTIVGSVRVPVVNPDVVPFLQRIKDAKPDVVFNFNPGGKQAIAFMTGWRDLGLKQAGVHIVATPDLVTDDELPNMGEEPLGMVSAGPYSTAAKRPQNEAFLALWKGRYGDSIIPNYAAVAGWDGMAAIIAVVKATKGVFTGDEAMAILSHWKNPESPRGPIAIDPETGDIVQNIYIRRVERVDGHLANVEFATIPQVKDPWKAVNPPK